MKIRQSLSMQSRPGYFFLLFLFYALLMTFNKPAFAAGSVCAEVKIEIAQELTLERQAFDAHMRINNGLSNITLEDVDIDVTFSDEAGNVVPAGFNPNDTTALFFIKIDSMDNIADVNGNGKVNPATSADIHWLIIPAPGASNGVPQGTLYYVGATLKYTIGGEEHTTEVTPDYIFVKPMPDLILDYFLPSEVFGDDAFTDEIEPPVPFTLGVRVANNGPGAAKQVKITSAQPKIKENKQGLLIGFVINGSEVNDSPAKKSLMADMGDIAPNKSSMARWNMECTLSGKFIDFKAEFSHSDELGGELTSLINAVHTHFLVRDVLADAAGRDSVKDFLAKDGVVYKVYESENTETPAIDISGSSSLAPNSGYYTITTPVTAGFIYLKLSDPYLGTKTIKEVVRSDGKYIKTENAWISKERNEQAWLYYLNLFDSNSMGSYKVTFENAGTENHAPVLQFIPDKSVIAGTQISFIVEATDPDGTIPSLTAEAVPAMASFTDKTNGSGIFNWTPTSAQAGQYSIAFKASDGNLEDSQGMTISVKTNEDTDSDGISDAWEISHFGTLKRDGTGDYDGDGVSDIEEFLNGTDPTQGNHAPSIPAIASPADRSEVELLQPTMVVNKSNDPENDPVSYAFELYADKEMKSMTASRTVADNGADTITWTPDSNLVENAEYFWRVRATDGSALSLWTYGSFFVNTQNDPPGGFGIAYPTDGFEVDSLTPRLEVTKSMDTDGDSLFYVFRLYNDVAMTNLIETSPLIPGDAAGNVSWIVGSPLSNNTNYYWKVAATDEHGMQTESPGALFLVNTQNATPVNPAIVLPARGSEVNASELDLTVGNATDADDDTLVYIFEIDKTTAFNSSSRLTSEEISQGTPSTSWHAANLQDNQTYYWRAKASDGYAESKWSEGSFFVNKSNNAPDVPIIRNPGAGAWTDTRTPELQLNPTIDADNDALSYRFCIYSDSTLDNLMAQGDTDSTKWTVTSSLTDNTRYYWRAQAIDEHGSASAWTVTSDFFVKNDGDNDPPEILMIAPAADIMNAQGNVVIRWEDADPDNNADVALFYDMENAGEDGTLITSQIKEDPDGSGDSYEWNTTGLPDGTYYIYASVSDGHSYASAYSSGSITIDRTAPFIAAVPPAGTYSSAQNVMLSVSETAEIYYTLDGSDPSVNGMLYSGPITIADSTTLKAIAVDLAENISTVFSASYVIQQKISVKVKTSLGRVLSGIKVYAFTAAGSYTGKSATADAEGNALFEPGNFSSGNYKFRADYLGIQFWSGTVSLLQTMNIDILIVEAPANVTIKTGSGPVSGVKVYVFSSTGAYLNAYAITDANGVVSFTLPAGQSFKFRADILGGQYWSGTTGIIAGQTNEIALNTGGGIFGIILQKAADSPIKGITIYLFTLSGTYLGQNGITNDAGFTSFSVPGASYKLRADYMGNQFWSDVIPVAQATNITFTIPHKQTEISVTKRSQSVNDPLQGIDVYLFNQSGSYLNINKTTDAAGMVSFDLPSMPYKVRADYMGQQYMSESFTWTDQTIAIPMADAEVTVTGAGLPKPNIKVYVFSATGSYLGVNGSTDQYGKVVFRIPAGSYKFRADYLSGQFWSDPAALAANVTSQVSVSVGGGAFTITAVTDELDPIVGASCYVFTAGESYVGHSGTTNATGKTSFNLANGEYKFRLDYMGQQYRSNVVSVPASASAQIVVHDEEVLVSVISAGVPAQGINVYLFSENENYLGQYRTTDPYGEVLFDLPVGSIFKFRADILGKQYMSSPITVVSEGKINDVSLNAGGGHINVTVQKATGNPIAGVKVYLLSDTDAYLGQSATTDASGAAQFIAPEGKYRIRADFMGYQFKSLDTLVNSDQSIIVEIPCATPDIVVSGLFQGVYSPIAGINAYLFTSDGVYIGKSDVTDSTGTVSFEVPNKRYVARADYMGKQYMSAPFTWVDAEIDILMADAQISVTGAGLPKQGLNVYAYSASGTYLGLVHATDANGIVTFRLPVGAYKFRADYLGNQYMTIEQNLLADIVNMVNISVGGGSFTLNVLDGASGPITGMKSYVFNNQGSYLGLSGSTDINGKVSFDLPNGNYQIRMDYLGYQFWSGQFIIPNVMTLTENIIHRQVKLSVLGDLSSLLTPKENIRLYLFNTFGTYLGKSQTTNSSGEAFFNLPQKAYRARADYLGSQYLSGNFTWQDATVTIAEGTARIHVHKSSGDVSGCRVYLFTDGGSYLSQYRTTDSSGTVNFILPNRAFKFRVDVDGVQYMSQVFTITPGALTSVDMNIE